MSFASRHEQKYADSNVSGKSQQQPSAIFSSQKDDEKKNNFTHHDSSKINAKIGLNFELIVLARAEDFALGSNQQNPFQIDEYQQFLQNKIIEKETDENVCVVIMDKNKWDEMDVKYKTKTFTKSVVTVIVCNDDINYHEQMNVFQKEKQTNKREICGVSVAKCFDDALLFVSTILNIECIYIIGGKELYELCYQSYFQNISRIYHFRIYGLKHILCNVYFPLDTALFSTKTMLPIQISEQNKQIRWEVTTLIPLINPPKHEEYQYINLIKKLLTTTVKQHNISSIFGTQMRFLLTNDRFPLFTTTEIKWKMIIVQLLSMVKGEITKEETKNCQNYSSYGFQWRHFGAEYRGNDCDYSKEGFDQLQRCLQQIKSNPNCRRIIMTSWNPADHSEKMKLPTDAFVQFYVANKKLSLQLYKTFANMNEIPNTIAMYAFLTKMIAHVCNLHCGELILSIGNAYINSNETDLWKDKIKRRPYKMPTLNITKKDIYKLQDFKINHFSVTGYNSYK